MAQVKIYNIVAIFLFALALGLAVSRVSLLAPAVLALAAGAIFFYFHPQLSFYFLVGYLPFQLALNLSSDVDLLSGRLAILVFFGVYIIKQIGQMKLKSQYVSSAENSGSTSSFFRTIINKISHWGNNHIFMALAAFFVISAASLLVAQNQMWGARKLLVFLSVFPLFFLTKWLMARRERVNKLLWIIVLVSTLSAAVAAGQFAGQFIFGRQAVVDFWSQYIIPIFSGQSFGRLVVQDPSWFVKLGDQTIMRAIGLFPDPHMLAFFLGLTSPLVLALFFYEKKYRLFLFTVYCFLVVILLLTFSRGGYLGFFASLMAIMFFSWRRFELKLKIFISSLFFVLFILLILTPVFGRLFSSFDLAEGSNASRLAIWSQSLDQASGHWLTGVGLGNYPLSLDFNAPYRSAVTSHNLYLDIFVETGIFGLLSWLLFLGATVRSALTKIKDADGFLSALAIGLFGAIIYFVVHSFFETPIYNPTILAFLMVVTGLVVSANSLAKEKI